MVGEDLRFQGDGEARLETTTASVIVGVLEIL
jgi:hypothetical protein